ncbi:MAG: NAD(P)/FAD-dependent oxidoreductase [Candidatus Eremiobacteraeota bacterium]|nr:NAD(P)/FAD-dependent oxidoreductase [Candidatus Eremiobacteraeota bacterium]
MTDVAIIGAGPAGSTLGLQLARSGYDVTLLERSRFPRVKVCGDYLCTGALASLRDLGVADAVLAGAHPIRSIALFGFDAQLSMRLEGSAASLPREILDDRLLAQTRACGARVVHGVYLRAEEAGRALRVEYRDHNGVTREFVTRVLVGADGAWSTVAQRAGMAALMRPAGRWAVGGKLPDRQSRDELSMYVGGGGYYARNPLGEDISNSMLVLPKPARPTEADEIVKQISAGSRRFEPENIERVVAVGPLRYRASRVARGRILLTGDAAELLDPFTGQGVATAMSLSFPAAAAATALLRGEPEARVARRYAAHWKSIVGPRRALGAVVEAVVRVRFLRERALRSIARDARAVYALLASVSGLAPARDALAPAVLFELLAS